MISVCIATYNSSTYILEQIGSIMPQLSSTDEIIISDDGSKDDTIEKISNLNDSRIKIFMNNGDHGYTPNFENALKHANGDYIFLSDHDDVWKPNKVEVCMNLLKKYDYIIHDATVTNEHLQPIATSYFHDRVKFRSLPGNLINFKFLGCLQAFKRCILKKALPFPCNHLYCTHDNWLYLIGATFYKSKLLDEQLMFYRRHEGTTSGGGTNEHKPWSFRISFRLYLIWHLFLRIFK